MERQPRYDLLDGIRGVAAVGVLLFHLSIVGVPDLMPRGYRAVDIFFMLSGFVIAYSYADKMPPLSLSGFIRRRALRMLPLSILGSMLGAGYFTIRSVLQPESLYSLKDILSGTIFNLLLLPKPWISNAPTDTIFPTNTPLWSLSLEVAINIVWAAFLIRTSVSVLGALAICSGALLALFIGQHGTADLGATWSTFVGGMLRAVFGFIVGVIICRCRPAPLKTSTGPWMLILLLIAALCLPQGGALADIVVILLIFPALMYWCVRFDDQAEHPFLFLLGRLSYPLYIVHVPILMLTAGVLKGLHLENSISFGIFAVVPICLIAAFLLDKFFDAPVRRYAISSLRAN